MTNVLPGTVLATRTPGGWRTPQWWIRFGAAVKDKPNLANHIAVPHHQDAHGTWWGIEGRPGGVGWVDCSRYLADPATITNKGQPLTTAQRAGICAAMEKLLGGPYDWAAIVADAEADLGIHMPGWDPSWHGSVPGHVVCSSAAQYAYLKAGAEAPEGDRGTQPADWVSFILRHGWQ